MDETPTKKVESEIKKILKENIHELVKVIKRNRGLSMFVEIESWFLQLSFDPGNVENCYVEHFDKDTWLDLINKEKEKPTESYWK